MWDQGAKADLVIARIAARQHGVVSVEQLRRAGLDKRATSRRVQAGRIHRIHRGVYAVGYSRLSFEGRCMAALLALGDGAAVSHQSAAALWGMLKPHSGPVHITLPGDGGRKRRSGITIHPSHSLTACLVTGRHGIALTKPARTLGDLHRTIPQPVYQRAVRRALDLRLINSAELKHEEELTRSELEKLMLRLCRRHRLPRPEVNDRGLIVETDGFGHHGNRSAFERDRARDAHLQSLGYRVLRFTHRQLSHERSAVIAALRPQLGQRSLAPNL